MRRLFAAVAIGALIGAAALTGVPAQAASCSGEGVITGTDTLVIPNGTVCSLTGPRTINTNIVVQPGGSLYLDGVLVKGAVNATSPKDIDIVNSGIGGALYVNGVAAGPPQTFLFCNNNIVGSATFSNAPATIIFGDGGTGGCGFPQGNNVCGALSASTVSPFLNVQSNTVKGSQTFVGDPSVVFTGNAFGGSGSTTRSNVSTEGGEANTFHNPAALNLDCSGLRPSAPRASLACTTPTTDSEHPAGDTADDSASQFDFGIVSLPGSATVTATCLASGPAGSTVDVQSVFFSLNTNNLDNSAAYSITGGTCVALPTLTTGQTCTVIVHFVPKDETAADFYKATLDVSHDGANGPDAQTFYEGSALLD
jgi:hypothetical protein